MGCSDKCVTLRYNEYIGNGTRPYPDGGNTDTTVVIFEDGHFFEVNK